MKIVIPQELSLPTIPAGTYRASFTGHKYKTTSTNKPAIMLELTLKSQGPIAEVKTVGRKMFDLITLQEDTMWRLNIPFRAATGADLPAGQAFSVEELVSFIVGSLMGKDVIISTDVEQYQGQARERVRSYAPVIG